MKRPEVEKSFDQAKVCKMNWIRRSKIGENDKNIQIDDVLICSKCNKCAESTRWNHPFIMPSLSNCFTLPKIDLYVCARMWLNMTLNSLLLAKNGEIWREAIKLIANYLVSSLHIFGITREFWECWDVWWGICELCSKFIYAGIAE